MELWRCQQQGLRPQPPLVHAHLQLLDQLLRPSSPAQQDASALSQPKTGELCLIAPSLPLSSPPYLLDLSAFLTTAYKASHDQEICNSLRPQPPLVHTHLQLLDQLLPQIHRAIRPLASPNPKQVSCSSDLVRICTSILPAPLAPSSLSTNYGTIGHSRQMSVSSQGQHQPDSCPDRQLLVQEMTSLLHLFLEPVHFNGERRDHNTLMKDPAQGATSLCGRGILMLDAEKVHAARINSIHHG